MLGRIFAYRMMVLAPAVLLIGVGIESRTYDDGFLPISMTASQMARVNAYIPLVNATTAAMHPTGSSIDRGRLRAIAREWTRAANAGELKDLAPVAYDDTSDDGVKDTIFRAKDDLTRHLANLVKEDGDTASHAAASDLILSLQVSEVAKFSDFCSVESAAIQQRNVLRRLRGVIPSLGPTDRREAEAELRKIELDQKPLDTIATLARIQYHQWCDRNDRKALDIDEPQRPATGASSTRHESLVASSDDRSASYVGVAEEASMLQTTLLTDLREIRSALLTPEPDANSRSVVLSDPKSIAVLHVDPKASAR